MSETVRSSDREQAIMDMLWPPPADRGPAAPGAPDAGVAEADPLG